MDINSCVKVILQSPSIILSSTDIALATRRISSISRRQIILVMIEKALLREDDFFVRQLVQKIKIVKVFAKLVPPVNDEAARYEFIKILHSFDISWDAFKSFFDMEKNVLLGFRTTTQLQLSQLAKNLFDSDDYKSYVQYDKRAVFREKEKNETENANLENGENITETNPHGLCAMHKEQVDRLGTQIMKFDPSNEVSDDECNVKRHELSANKTRTLTYGFLASFYSCGIIAGFDESIRSESPRRVLRHLIKIGKFLPTFMWSNIYFIGKIGKLPLGIMYDNACSVKLYVNARYSSVYFKSTSISNQLFNKVHFVLDSFHQQNHTRHMCKNEMKANHPSHNNMFDCINSQIAEQTFSTIRHYKAHWSSYTYPKSFINFVIFFHLYNCKLTNTLF
ncbi:unnamed protein product [Rotaria magnacalcarata]|uniref:Uncharacterized protein n=1 Tax=Rotaria magnacalcarata TaxID=392030 RepID=A0A815NTG8_9BILA|nr:unnamed protein product [Rotaria magnacalcarata]